MDAKGVLLGLLANKQLPEPERNDLVEAQMILKGLTLLQPSVDHLKALEEHYEVRLIQLCNDLEVVKRKVLNG